MRTAALEAALSPELREIRPGRDPAAIPALAKDPASAEHIRERLAMLDTAHEVILGDARRAPLARNSVHLAVTSPPYWTLKEYPEREGQIGGFEEYPVFLEGLRDVWRRCFDALAPGGRLVCVVGDVCLSRRRSGRHRVIPLHADILAQCVDIGFDNLAPILWQKISNAKTESGRSGTYLGKPFEPNGVIKNDIEFILMLRKPGGYRSPAPAARLLSVIPAQDHARWFRQIWTGIPGASTRDHPAPFPVALAERLIRMFSFAGDTVLDPFTGTGSTQAAARRCGRNSIGIEIEPAYHAMAMARLAER